jgi:uncharacterized membrane protein
VSEENLETFTLTQDHVTVLKSAHLEWQARHLFLGVMLHEHADSSRGSRYLAEDLAHELGWWDGHGMLPDDVCKKVNKICREAGQAMKVVLSAGTFKPGVYVADAHGVEWRPTLERPQAPSKKWTGPNAGSPTPAASSKISLEAATEGARKILKEAARSSEERKRERIAREKAEAERKEAEEKALVTSWILGTADRLSKELAHARDEDELILIEARNLSNLTPVEKLKVQALADLLGLAVDDLAAGRVPHTWWDELDAPTSSRSYVLRMPAHDLRCLLLSNGSPS